MTPLKNAVVFDLQLFADEGSAAAGDNSSAPPAADTGDTSSTAVPPVTDEATDAAAPGTEIQNDNTQPRLTFKELLENKDTAEEAKAFVNEKFSERYKDKVKAQEDENAKMRAILDLQNIRYGLDPDSETYLDDLSERIKGDAKLFEDAALAAGMDVDSYMKVAEADKIIAQNKRDSAQREQEQIINNHIMNLRQQEVALKEKFPSFDLETELQDRHFRSLVDPPALGGSGLPLENAYYALHYKDINKNVASQAYNQAASAVANSVAANKARPSENVNAKTPSTTPTKSFEDWTKEDFDKARAEYERTGISPF